MNLIVLTKVAWSFVFFTVEGALYHLLLAALGLLICNAVLVVGWRWSMQPSASLPRPPDGS